MKRRLSCCLLVLGLFVILGLPLPAFAGPGAPKTIYANGIPYTGTVSVGQSGSRMYARSYAGTGQAVPSGYIWTQATLLRNGTSVGTIAGENPSSSTWWAANYYETGWAGRTYSATGKFGGFNPVSGTYVKADQYKAPNLTYYANTFFAEEASPFKLVDLVYQTNDVGETYGSAAGEELFGVMPDWISACATNGQEGYIKASDHEVPMPLNPSDAVTNYSEQRVKEIPVYSEPSSNAEVIGYYHIYYGGSGSNLQ